MQKRLSIIIDAFTKGGAQKVLLELVPFWQEQGLSIQLVVLQNSDSELPLESFFELNINVVRIDAKSLTDIRGFLRLYRELSYFKPELVQSHLYWSQMWGSLFKFFNRSVAIIWVEHNMYIYRTRLQWYIYRLLGRKTQEIVAVSKEVANYLYGKNLKNVRFIPNPVSRKFSCRFLEKRENVFVFIGRLNSQKNPILALDAFRFSIYENLIPEDSRLVYAGEGKLETQIRDKIMQYGLNEQVSLLGFMSELELSEVLNNSKCLVSTSLHEGFSLARIEALATGCTIVTTKTGGISGVLTQSPESEILIPGVFVALPTPQSLATAFSMAISDEFWSDKDIRFRVKSAKSYNPNIIAKKYIF